MKLSKTGDGGCSHTQCRGAKDLVDLLVFNGESEVMTQIAFLRGWIHFSRNETLSALGRFRELIQAYPGTSYATQTMGLIRRLEDKFGANGS